MENFREDLVGCPICTMTDLLDGGDHHECATCGHEWDKAEPETVVIGVNGNELREGDDVVIIKDLKLDGKSGGIKVGTKVKSIRIVPGDHPIQGKVNGRTVLITADKVKKA